MTILASKNGKYITPEEVQEDSEYKIKNYIIFKPSRWLEINQNLSLSVNRETQNRESSIKFSFFFLGSEISTKTDIKEKLYTESKRLYSQELKLKSTIFNFTPLFSIKAIYINQIFYSGDNSITFRPFTSTKLKISHSWDYISDLSQTLKSSLIYTNRDCSLKLEYVNPLENSGNWTFQGTLNQKF